jgi:hypothetical protein
MRGLMGESGYLDVRLRRRREIRSVKRLRKATNLNIRARSFATVPMEGRLLLEEDV